MEHKKKVATLLYPVAAVLLLAVLLSIISIPAAAEKLAGITNLEQLYLKANSTAPVLKVNQTSTGNIVQFEDNGTTVFSVADGGAADITTSLTVGTWAQFEAQTYITVTQDGWITATGTYQPIANHSAAVQTSNLYPGMAGQLLILINEGANAITISDTGTLKLSGDAVLGQYDTLVVLSDGTNWIELAQANN